MTEDEKLRKEIECILDNRKRNEHRSCFVDDIASLVSCEIGKVKEKMMSRIRLTIMQSSVEGEQQIGA